MHASAPAAWRPSRSTKPRRRAAWRWPAASNGICAKPTTDGCRRARRSVFFDMTLELATENARVNESLFRNGKITRDLVFRAEADQLEVQQAQLGAQNAERLAQSYVNLIRNAPFERTLPSLAVEDPDIERLRNDLAARTAQPALS